MENLLIEFDEAGYKSEISTLEALGKQFENIISQYNSIGIGNLEPAEFLLLFTDPEKVLFDRFMEGDDRKIQGKSIIKEELFKIYEKPAAYFPFIEQMSKFNASMKSLSISKYTKIYIGKSVPKILALFNLENLQEITLKQETFKQVKFLFEDYATTPKSKTFFLFATEIQTFLKESEFFKKTGISNKDAFIRFLDCIEFTGTIQEPVKINVQRVQYIDHG